MRTSLLLLALLAGCGGGSSSSAPPPATETSGSEPVDTTSGTRPTMTEAECAARGGTVVGDIGDGAVHRADYVCPSGLSPIGTVPIGIEGSVCCP